MRTILDIFVQIFRNLWSHKLRSFLTMFGIAWGVGSLLLLVGVGEGFRSGNKRELAEFGKDWPDPAGGVERGLTGQEITAYLNANFQRARSSRRSRALAARSSGSRSVPTASSSPAAARTRRSTSGRCPTARSPPR